MRRAQKAHAVPLSVWAVKVDQGGSFPGVTASQCFVPWITIIFILVAELGNEPVICSKEEVGDLLGNEISFSFDRTGKFHNKYRTEPEKKHLLKIGSSIHPV